MPVFKNKTQGKYVNVYKGIATDHELSLKDRGMLLTLLSLPDNWNFTVAGLRKILPDGKSAIYSSIDSLQKSGYLTKEQSRGDGGIFAENIIEVHETPFSENRETEKRVSDIPLPDKPISEKQSQVNNNEAITKKEIINEINKPSINHGDAMDEMKLYSVLVKDNIGYDALLYDYPEKPELIDEIVELIVDTVSVERKTIRISGNDFPYQVVKSRFLKLNSSHIRYVLTCMDNNTTKIINIRNYLLTALYNAPSTISSYYKAEVNHDLYREE